MPVVTQEQIDAAIRGRKVPDFVFEEEALGTAPSGYDDEDDDEDIGEPVEPEPRITEHQWRKNRPLFRGVLAYFPDALMEVANVSRIGNEQHNPGQPMHWAFGKSDDHADCVLRHLIDGDECDGDGVLHAAKAAWRALANLQELLEGSDPALHEKRQAQRERAARGER